MKWVFQRGETDCSVAALAMLADVSYEEAESYLLREAGRKRSISSGYMIRGLEHFGRSCLGDRCRAVGERQLYDLDNDALLSGKLLIKVDIGQKEYRWKEDGHWCVWDSTEQVIRDPYGYGYPFWVQTLIEVQ